MEIPPALGAVTAENHPETTKEESVAVVQAEASPDASPKASPEAKQIAEDAFSFEAVIDRSSGALGLYLDLSDGLSLYICRVNEEKGSPAQAYNDGAHPDRKVKRGDYILVVNGVSGSASELARVVKEGGRLTLKIQRPVVATHKVNKNGQAMGLDLQFARNSTVLCVSKVLDGAVKSSGFDIRHGDRIICVNSKEGNCEQLLEEMKISDTPEIIVSRCVEVSKAYEKGFRPDAKPVA